MSAEAADLSTEWTEARLQAMPENGFTHEVVGGELIISPKNNWFHGRICTRLIIALGNFAREHRLGAVLDSSTGFWMFNHNCRAPDVSFVPARRLQSLGFKPSERRFFPGAPDLAIEILSPNNTRAEIVDPENQTAEICHAQTDRRLIGSGALLEGEHLLPGFQLPLADLFKDREWE